MNPYLTDATGILIIACAVHALVTRRYVLFAIACTVGIGVREATIFLSPAWSTRRGHVRAGAVVAASLAAYVAIRRCIGPLGPDDPGPFKEFPARPIRDVVLELASAWHALWVLAPLGLSLLASRGRPIRGAARRASRSSPARPSPRCSGNRCA